MANMGEGGDSWYRHLSKLRLRNVQPAKGLREAGIEIRSTENLCPRDVNPLARASRISRPRRCVAVVRRNTADLALGTRMRSYSSSPASLSALPRSLMASCAPCRLAPTGTSGAGGGGGAGAGAIRNVTVVCCRGAAFGSDARFGFWPAASFAQ